MTRSLANTRKLINCIVISHGTVALGTDRPQVVYAQGPALTLGNIMAGFKIEYRYDILTPCDETLVFKLFSYPCSPYLLAKSFGYRGLLH
jgi:hypothetical protein